MIDPIYTANVLRSTEAGLLAIEVGIIRDGNSTTWVVLRLAALAARIADEVRELEATKPDSQIAELQNAVDILHQDGDRWRGIAQDFKRDLDQVRNENVQLLQRLRHSETKPNPERQTP